MRNVIIYEVPGADPALDRTVVGTDAGSTTTLVAADGEAIEAAAVGAADAGADRIELCGGLGVAWQARVIDLVGSRVPVGAVMYGFESLEGVADYKARYGHEPLREAFVYIQPGSIPDTDRMVREDELTRSLHVAVPDAAAALDVARQLVDDEGVQLLELYGGFSPAEAARVIDAIGGRAPVGLPSYGYAGAQLFGAG